MARTHYLAPHLYNKLYAVMQYENALALRTSLETGWRISDVLGLKLSDLNGRTLRCVAMKTGKPDKKVISADLAKRLRQIAAHGRLFDGRFGTKPRQRQTVWKDVKKAAKRLQLDGNIAPHSARKTYGVEDFKENGLRQVQDDLQHDSINTTMLYAFADLIDKKPALARRLTDSEKGAASRPLDATSAALEVGATADEVGVMHCADGAVCRAFSGADRDALLQDIADVVRKTMQDVLTTKIMLDKKQARMIQSR